MCPVFLNSRSGVPLLAALALWWLGCARPPDYTNFPPQNPGDWVAFGDSLTAGYEMSPDQSYPALLAVRLGVSIRNEGVSGNTTADGLQRVAALVAARPRVVLLCLGGNDGLRQVPRAETFGNLSAIIEQLQTAGAFVVLIGVRSATIRDKYAEEFERLAKARRTLYVPNILDGLLAKPALMLDQVHPNAAGYAVIAERLEKMLRPLLPQLVAPPTGG
ncbi:arylesterase [Verrucomicrobiota bacterium]|nr:arylesterase [Verrucomicrobiota bacterium]